MRHDLEPRTVIDFMRVPNLSTNECRNHTTDVGGNTIAVPYDKDGNAQRTGYCSRTALVSFHPTTKATHRTLNEWC